MANYPKIFAALDQLRQTVGNEAYELFCETMKHGARAYDLDDHDSVAAEAATEASAAARHKLRMRLGEDGIRAMAPSLQAIFDNYAQDGCYLHEAPDSIA